MSADGANGDGGTKQRFELYIKASAIDKETKGSCPMCQHWFMITCVLGEKQDDIDFKVYTVQADCPPKNFGVDQGWSKKFPVVMVLEGRDKRGQDLTGTKYDTFEELEIFFESINKDCPALKRKNAPNVAAMQAVEDVYNAFNIALPSGKENKRLASALKKINDFLESDDDCKFLVDDVLSFADCYILPRLQHIRVAGKEYMNYDIPSKYTAIWKYLSDAYQMEAFRSTMPSDQDIVFHYEKKVGHLLQGKKRRPRPTLQSFTYTLDIPEDIALMLQSSVADTNGDASQPSAPVGDMAAAGDMASQQQQQEEEVPVAFSQPQQQEEVEVSVTQQQQEEVEVSVAQPQQEEEVEVSVAQPQQEEEVEVSVTQQQQEEVEVSVTQQQQEEVEVPVTQPQPEQEEVSLSQQQQQQEEDSLVSQQEQEGEVQVEREVQVEVSVSQQVEAVVSEEVSTHGDGDGGVVEDEGEAAHQAVVEEASANQVACEAPTVEETTMEVVVSADEAVATNAAPAEDDHVGATVATDEGQSVEKNDTEDAPVAVDSGANNSDTTVTANTDTNEGSEAVSDNVVDDSNAIGDGVAVKITVTQVEDGDVKAEVGNGDVIKDMPSKDDDVIHTDDGVAKVE